MGKDKKGSTKQGGKGTPEKNEVTNVKPAVVTDVEDNKAADKVKQEKGGKKNGKSKK